MREETALPGELSREDLWAMIQELRQLSEQQQEEIQRLKDQLAKNSGNSGKPPSSDGLKKPVRTSLRAKGQRRSGGQTGHPGTTLCQVSNPDYVVEHSVEQCCPYCATELSQVAVSGVEKRQVFEVPALRLMVTEHRGAVKQCPGCGEQVKAVFPAEAAQPVQYGQRMQAQLAYLYSYQLLPLARIQALMQDFYGQRVSEAMILNSLTRLEQAIAPSLAAIKSQLVQAAVVHSDETGVRVAGKTQWWHVFSTRHLTVYWVHPQRGQVAFQAGGLLPQFTGRVVHDAYASYFVLTQCDHALCNVHLLRDLVFLHEHYQLPWAHDLHLTLLAMKKAVEQAQMQGHITLTPAQLTTFEQQFDHLLAQGFDLHPPPPVPILKRRGRLKQSPALNLLQRLAKHKSSVLAFLYDFRVPFDNNLAERDLRMVKVKQKIAGSFRTPTGAATFAAIRSYLSTVRKHAGNVLDAITLALRGFPFIPAYSPE